MRAAAIPLLLLSSLVARAEPERTHPRFHVLDEPLAARLSAGARRNRAAVVAFPRASGFVVAADPKRPRRILILTNFHVAGSGPPAGAVSFHDGTLARPLRTVAKNPRLDYALVEAELSEGPRAGGVAPLELERGEAPLHAGELVYALGGHTGLDGFGRDGLAGGAVVEAKVAREIAAGKTQPDPAGFRTIALGRVGEGTPHRIRAGGHVTLGVGATLPNAPGMSGSPVLSRATHRVVGLHFAGTGASSPSWIESSVPIDLVLRDLAHGLARGKIDPGARDLVERLVEAR